MTGELWGKVRMLSKQAWCAVRLGHPDSEVLLPWLFRCRRCERLWFAEEDRVRVNDPAEIYRTAASTQMRGRTNRVHIPADQMWERIREQRGRESQTSNRRQQ